MTAVRREKAVVNARSQAVRITGGRKVVVSAAGLTCAGPTCAPKFPADVKRHVRLAGASSHIDEHARLAAEDGTNDTVDGNFLIVAQRLSGHWKAGREKALLLVFGFQADVSLQ